MVVVSDNSTGVLIPKSIKEKKRASGYRKGMPRLTFECSKEFYERVMHEKDQRHLTVQQLALRALERYFAVPEYVHRGIDEVVVGDPAGLTSSGDAARLYYAGFLKNSIAKSPDGALRSVAQSSSPMSERDLEVWGLAHEIGTYLKQLPVEKLRVLRQSLVLDVKYYRSARIKPAAVNEE